jgi:hypothetical protein
MSTYTKEVFYGCGQIQWRRYYANARLHREDGPAVESFYEDGTLSCQKWFIHGLLHRDDKPAVYWFWKQKIRQFTPSPTVHEPGNDSVCPLSDRAPIIESHEWYNRGKRHREDGPAKEYFTPSGRCSSASYYLDDEKITRKEHLRRIALLKLSKDLSNRKEISL